MRDRTEWPGVWWLGDQPNERVSGTLTYDPFEGLSLALIGSFGGLPNFNTEHRPDLLLGVSARGKHITLLDCIRTGGTITMPGMATSKYECRVALVGHHFDNPADLEFASLSLEYPYVMEWTGVSGFRIVDHPESDDAPVKTVEYRFPERMRSDIPGAQVSLEYVLRTEGDRVNAVSLNQETLLQLSFIEPKTFDELWSNYRYHIDNFLTFASGTEIRPFRAILTSDSALTPRRYHPPAHKQLEVFTRSREVAAPARRHDRYDMLFHLADIGPSFGPALSTWVRKAEILGPIYDLYFGLRYGRGQYLQFQLLGAVQALEVLHRRTANVTYLDDESFASVAAALNASLPPDLPVNARDAFRSRIGYMNELSLRSRLRELIARNEAVVRVGIPDHGQFVRLVTDTRNYLTHYDPALVGLVAEGELLHLIARQTMFLLEVCLLRQLEMPDDVVHQIVTRNRRYQELGRWAQEAPRTG